MSLDYHLPTDSQDPIVRSKSFRIFKRGPQEGIIVGRLLHKWFTTKVCFVKDRKPVLYSLWVDKEENLIEGFTNPNDARIVSSRIAIGQLYQMTGVVVITANENSRAAPADRRLYLLRTATFRPIPENCARWKFPTEAFRHTPLRVLQQPQQNPVVYADVTGCVPSATKTKHRTDGLFQFKLTIQESSGRKAMIHYLGEKLL